MSGKTSRSNTFISLLTSAHVCVCVGGRAGWGGRGEKKNAAEWQREKTITNRMSPRKWSLVNKGEMELIFQTCIQVPFGEGGAG